MANVLRRAFPNSKCMIDWFFSESVSLKRFEFHGSSIRDDLMEKYNFRGDLAEIYIAGSQQLVHKWHHYLPIYDRYFSAWREKPVRFLEIGVSKGGSISMWRRYFGESSTIYGIDIDEDCRQYDGIDGCIRIGSQGDPDFLKSVITEMGGVDIILDDGSHIMHHIKESLEILLPVLETGGVYMIEDLHTAYWKDYGGGVFQDENFFNYVRELVDDMHKWYHHAPVRHPAVSEHCGSIHIYDSVCVIEKNQRHMPVHSKVQLK